MVEKKIMLFLCIFLFTIHGLSASKNDDLVATLFRLCNYDEIDGLSYQEIQHCQVSLKILKNFRVGAKSTAD